MFMLESFLFKIRFIVMNAMGIWFVVWALRRRYDLDEQLDHRMQIIRWLVVIIGISIGSFPSVRYGIIKVLAGLNGIAFWCWPNFAYRLTSIFYGARSQSKD